MVPFSSAPVGNFHSALDTVTERARFSLRAEAFNVFNHTNLGDPNSTVTDPNAGQITGLAPNFQMRRLQFGFRMDF